MSELRDLLKRLAEVGSVSGKRTRTLTAMLTKVQEEVDRMDFTKPDVDIIRNCHKLLDDGVRSSKSQRKRSLAKSEPETVAAKPEPAPLRFRKNSEGRLLLDSYNRPVVDSDHDVNTLAFRYTKDGKLVVDSKGDPMLMRKGSYEVAEDGTVALDVHTHRPVPKKPVEKKIVETLEEKVAEMAGSDEGSDLDLASVKQGGGVSVETPSAPSARAPLINAISVPAPDSGVHPEGMASASQTAGGQEGGTSAGGDISGRAPVQSSSAAVAAAVAERRRRVMEVDDFMTVPVNDDEEWVLFKPRTQRRGRPEPEPEPELEEEPEEDDEHYEAVLRAEMERVAAKKKARINEPSGVLSDDQVLDAMEKLVEKLEKEEQQRPPSTGTVGVPVQSITPQQQAEMNARNAQLARQQAAAAQVRRQMGRR